MAACSCKTLLSATAQAVPHSVLMNNVCSVIPVLPTHAVLQVRIVFDDGTHKVMTISEAQKQAAKLGKDLLPVAMQAKPPVFKLGHRDMAAAAERKRQKELRRRELEQRRKLAVKEVTDASGHHAILCELDDCVYDCTCLGPVHVPSEASCCAIGTGQDTISTACIWTSADAYKCQVLAASFERAIWLL